MNKMPRKKKVVEKVDVKALSTRDEGVEESIASEEGTYSFNLPQNEVKSERADVFKRFLAFGFDALIFYLIFFQIFFYIYTSMAGISYDGSVEEMRAYLEGNSEIMEKTYIGICAGSVLFLIYLSVFQFLYRATPGMMFFSLHLRGSLERFGALKVILINLSISVLIPLFLVDILSIFITEKKQRLSEYLSGLYIEKKSALSMGYEVYM